MKKILLVLSFLIISCYFVEGKTFYFIHVYNGTQTGSSGPLQNYTVSSSTGLMVKAWVLQTGIGGYIDSTTAVDWYLDSVYQFTAGEMVTFNQPGLISFDGSDNAIQLSITIGINDFSFIEQPFPFSQISSSVNFNNLRYTVMDLLGNVVDAGSFAGKIILRDASPQKPLHPGIYFVIYSDALDNRQVLTDKVAYNRK